MLKKDAIIKIMSDLQLPPEEYWIGSGAALVIHEVKENTNDIDLGCTNKLWEYFLAQGYTYKVEKDGSYIMPVNECVELIKEWAVEEVEFVEGLPVGTLESIKKQKAKLGREKDFNDIKLIDEFIANRN